MSMLRERPRMNTVAHSVIAFTTLLALFWAPLASAAEIRMLSAGAVEIGLMPVLAAFERQTGDSVRVSFAAAPAIGPRLAAEPGFDVVIAPQAVLDELARRGALGDERVAIGTVGIGVAARTSAAPPDIASVDALSRELVRADAVVFNRASTGLYVEKMLKTLGLVEVVDAKAVRVDDGAAVMRRLLAGTASHEFGFAAMTEIVLFDKQGITLVGPLPAALQNSTTYVAAPRVRSPAIAGNAASVAALLAHLRSAAARDTFASSGIAPAH